MTGISGMWNELYLSCPNCNEDAVRMDLVWDTEEVHIHNNGNGTAVDIQAEYVCSKCGRHLIYAEYFENGNDASSLILKSDVAFDQLQDTANALFDECMGECFQAQLVAYAGCIRDMTLRHKDLKSLLDNEDDVKSIRFNIDSIKRHMGFDKPDCDDVKTEMEMCLDDIEKILGTEY